MEQSARRGSLAASIWTITVWLEIKSQNLELV